VRFEIKPGEAIIVIEPGDLVALVDPASQVVAGPVAFPESLKYTWTIEEYTGFLFWVLVDEAGEVLFRGNGAHVFPGDSFTVEEQK
jgi:hypothetical protein